MEQTYGEWIRSNPPMPTKNLNTKHMAEQNEEQKPTLQPTDVVGTFYFRDFVFETIGFEHTEDATVLIRCDSREDLVTFEMSKQEAIEMALAILKNCL
jgi:hypothetical protein